MSNDPLAELVKQLPLAYDTLRDVAQHPARYNFERVPSADLLVANIAINMLRCRPHLVDEDGGLAFLHFLNECVFASAADPRGVLRIWQAVREVAPALPLLDYDPARPQQCPVVRIEVVRVGRTPGRADGPNSDGTGKLPN